jgi:hypothetical protein
MLIALDYDDTYTRDPVLWLDFVHKAQARGHTVICATMRYQHETLSMCVKLQSAVEIICTSRQAKQPYLHAQGLFPDIWIDDSPHWLFEDAM